VKKKTSTVWIAACAILLQALWPLLSHARPAEAPQLVPLCTISGETHYLELKTGKQSPLEQGSANHAEHCKLCVLEGDKDCASTAGVVCNAVLETEEEKVGSGAHFSFSPTLPAARSRAPPANT
jgi:hypothetical protein